MNTWTARVAASLTLLAPAAARAQDVMEDVADTGDTAWLLSSASLGLLMVLLGLALFYGGRVRARNFVSTVLQIGAVLAAVSILWVIVGYTLAFGPMTNGWIGAGTNWMLGNLGNVRDGTDVPESAFALFRMAFAVLAPALLIGTWAERARFGWVVTFCALWSLIVYAPVAHWVWDGGWLATKVGTLDFAGGIVVQTSAGVTALVTAALLGKRTGFPGTPVVPHSPALALAGALLLWLGWFALSGGSAFAANDDAASAIINTHVATCVAVLVWLLIERIKSGKQTAIGFATGAIAGLAAISPAAGFISPGGAVIIGLVAPLVCFPMASLVHNKLHIDDAMGVFAVGGVGGITGSLLLAVFMAPGLGGTGDPLSYSMAQQFTAQVIGVGVVLVWSAIASVILALAVNLVFPMRVSEDDEREGLDLSSHGERAWELD